MGTESSGKRRLTRRRVLKAGATALGGGTALLTGMPEAGAQNAQAPAVLANTQTGRTFRGLVRHANTIDVQQMRLRGDSTTPRTKGPSSLFEALATWASRSAPAWSPRLSTAATTRLLPHKARPRRPVSRRAPT